MSLADPRLFAHRLVVLDTETTGLDAMGDDRIVEIGAVELIGCLPSGREFHSYLNPGRAMPAAAERVHGLSDAFLADKPVFAQIAGDLLGFLGESTLVIHNAAFDVGFLNAELLRCGLPPVTWDRALCTVELARRRLPGARHSLDALCERYAIDRSARVRHGALLDAQLLARVYLELLGGAQMGLSLAPPAAAGPQQGALGAATGAVDYSGRTPAAHGPTPAEFEAHAAFVARMREPLWTAAGAGGAG
jgi:DNA polymerase-3 subunit epsilon